MSDIPFVDLEIVGQRASEALANSEELAAYCIEKFGKEPLVIRGVEMTSPPTNDHCPYFAIYHIWSDQETDNLSFKVQISIEWGCVNDNITQEGRLIVCEGFDDALKLGRLAYDVLYNMSDRYPATGVELNASLGDQGQWIGNMIVQIEIEAAFGEKIIF